MKKFITLLFFCFLLLGTKSTTAQKYYVITSSTPSLSVANESVEKLRASGFVNADLLRDLEKKRYRVYLNSFDSRELADEETEKYKNKYKGIWILEYNDIKEIKPVNSTQSNFSDKNYEDLRNDLASTKTKYDQFQNELSEIRNEIKNIKELISQNNSLEDEGVSKLEERISFLDAYIEDLERKNDENANTIKDLNEKIDKINSDYLTKADTVDYSWSLVKNPIGFSDSRFFLSAGITQSNLFSGVDQDIQSYFNMNSNEIEKFFYSLNVGAGYKFTKKLSSEISLKTYISNYNAYLFPSIDLKFSQPIGKSPISINPSFSLGTEALLFKNEKIRGARYMFISPGIEIEIGFNKISIFGTAKYNFITQYKDSKFVFNKGNCFDLNYGMRFYF